MKPIKPVIFAFLLLIGTGIVRAQSAQGLTSQPNQTDSALTAQTRVVFQSVSANVIRAAREMPEKSYDFKPTSGDRTFGELIVHIANVQESLCANMDGHPARTAARQQSKDNLISDLANSASDCQAAFDELSAENANKLVQTSSGQLTHLSALIYIITHASEEYGQMGVYLRLNHLEPPTSDEAKGKL